MFDACICSGGPIGATKSGAGEVNVPVCCGEQVVMSGDIVIADEDGIVCFNEEEYKEIYTLVISRIDPEEIAKKLIEEDIGTCKLRRNSRVKQWTKESGYYCERIITDGFNQ